MSEPSKPDQQEATAASQTTQAQANSQDNAEIRISRSTMYATWAGVAVAIGTSIYTLVTTSSSEQEILKITKLERQTSVPTQIKETSISLATSYIPGATEATKSRTGIISAYWKVFISNNSKKDISIVKYEINQVLDGNKKREAWYTGLNQGLYTLEKDKLTPFNLPLTIPEGNTAQVYVKAGIYMHPSSYKLVKERFKQKPMQMKEVEKFLNTKSTDFFGNMVKPITMPYPIPDQAKPLVGFEYSSDEELKEQAFAISFETARDSRITEIVSWYKYSGLFDIKK